jgi:hypothetical protein
LQPLQRLVDLARLRGQLCFPQDAELLGEFGEAPGEGADRGHVIVGEGQRAAAQFGLVQLAGDVIDRGAFVGDLRAPSLQMVEHARVCRAQQDVGRLHQAAYGGGLVGDAAACQRGLEPRQLSRAQAGADRRGWARACTFGSAQRIVDRPG